MESLIYSLQKLQLHSPEPIEQQPVQNSSTPKPITKGVLVSTCLELYHENIALKKEIQRLMGIHCKLDPKIPKWVH